MASDGNGNGSIKIPKWALGVIVTITLTMGGWLVTWGQTKQALANVEEKQRTYDGNLLAFKNEYREDFKDFKKEVLDAIRARAA